MNDRCWNRSAAIRATIGGVVLTAVVATVPAAAPALAVAAAQPPALAAGQLVGSASCTTDASGYCTVAHALGSVPRSVLIEPTAPIGGQSLLPFQHAVDTVTATSYRVRWLTTTGAAYPSRSVTWRYRLAGAATTGDGIADESRTCLTDASGYCTVDHSLGRTPATVLVQPTDAVVEHMVDSITATSYRVRFIAFGGAAYANTWITWASDASAPGAPLAGQPDTVLDGTVSCTTDTGGWCTVGHSLDAVPAAVHLEPAAPLDGKATLPYQAWVDQPTAAAYRVRVQTATGTPYASQAVTWWYRVSGHGAPTGDCPGCMPVGDIPGWHQVVAEDFTRDSATGSWGTACDPDHVDYTGATGVRWRSYPRCYVDTGPRRAYRSDAVLSTHDGVLDFFLHPVDGVPAGANPSPILDNGTMSQYQVYGRYSARIRLDATDMSDYATAWLLWPADDANWQFAESDYPEGSLASNSFNAFHHFGGSGAQDAFGASTDRTGWHVYTQEWGPGFRRYYLDGTLIGTSTNQVYAQPERWQLQTETVGSGTSTGHLYVDWAVVYSYHP